MKREVTHDVLLGFDLFVCCSRLSRDALDHLRASPGAIVLGSVLLAAITFLIGGIALRSLIALREGTFLPAS
jgi:hypothetical protein